MTFEKGKSGNPSGRPKGVLNKRSELADLLKPHAPELINKAVELSLAGDVNALRLCLERLIPKAKDSTISLELNNKDLSKAEPLLNCNSLIINAVSTGELTPEQGRALTSIITSQSKLIELTDVEKRLGELEQALKKEGRF